ncbi:AAA family ATPase [Rubrivirga marina]|uniref:Orc1-like AAA ATPase domain-containing protein n=1 Tax=Rubrivirga marina TaxID=1196024 RepID=A0A271IUU2_9BACT|nr:AAA family ATPase [Rubrivirga marina]PAP74554.1 hypothetical protein BSZ37_20450 [Rubrivirga marina]
MTNPFEFGRELSASELVDRADEVDTVLQTMEDGGRLFLIGPRRFGKTSILRAAAERARAGGAVVLRHNAEAYPTLSLLSRALVADAATHLTGSIKKAGQKIQEAFGVLRPQLSYNPLDQSFSVSLGAAASTDEEVLLVEALDGLDKLAGASGKRVAVVIDEFQQVVERGGVEAEGQVRAAVQSHDHLAYVFAGSKTALLSEMTGDPARPFYRLGSRLFVGPIPRDDFRPFLQAGFEGAPRSLGDDAVEAILDLAEDVPYNVQRLAHECWATVRSEGADGPLTEADVRDVLDRLVRRDDPFYTQTWNRLTAAQQKSLLAVVATDGTGLYSRPILRQYGLPLSTMRTALDALVRIGVAREEEARGSVRHRLEDPFFAAWLSQYVVRP